MSTAVTPSDDELVRRTRLGDLDAFGELTERYREVVYRVAARIVGPSDAEDVAQDALLRAFHRLDQFRGEAPFRSWLLRITQNAALNFLEKRRAIPVAEADQMAEEQSLREGGPKSPVSSIEDSERRDRLRMKISQLREQHRDVLVMRDLGELSYEEIAEVTGTPLGSVKGRLHRARRELIELLRNNTYDWELPA
ncbi:MAG: sigma-70 family RNA polymerase sigma factor [Thermoleophilia bacterium]|nr:sigma-70 family RNA polymerase sigma factor [Thermoleophilia bacterium]MDH3725039.1 sigma-70 family RNA polymerase sigma factor [Thermoleophilia bacterium]